MTSLNFVSATFSVRISFSWRTLSRLLGIFGLFAFLGLHRDDHLARGGLSAVLDAGSDHLEGSRHAGAV
jgi:hypothetical protein